MSRNYENEIKWAKNSYIEVRARVSKKQYDDTFNKIKDSIGVANFIRTALEIYKSNPELFKDGE